MNDAILPDMKKHVIRTTREVLEKKPKSIGEKREEALHALGQGHGWNGGLKPYILARIEILKSMNEVDFKGTESLEEIGTRFVVSSAVIKEMQDLIAIVEATTKAVQRIADDKKNKAAARKK